MKQILNLSAIFLIITFAYLPFLGNENSLVSSINFLNWSIFSKSKNTNNISSNPVIGSVSNEEKKEQKSKKSTTYIDSLIDVWKNTDFSQSDLKKVKKTKDGKAMSVEEMAKLAEVSGISDDIKQSLEIWRQLDEKVASNLKDVIVNNQNDAGNQKMLINWYKYHAGYAKELAEAGSSKDKIRKINEDYSINVKYYLPGIQKYVEADLDVRPLWVQTLINNAKAVGIWYDFGGLVTWTQPCDQGFLFYALGVKGGIFGIYYAVYAINPYLYRNIIPSAYVLGKSAMTSFTCTDIGIPTGVAPFTVIFFGTSAL